MANLGLMAGLGEGLQQLGGSIYKTKVLDKLKEEETIRAEKRKEAKEANTVKEQRYVNKDGVWYEQDISLGTGRPIDERLAPKSKIDELNRNEEKERLAVETATLARDKARREEGYAAEDRALDLDAARAKIAESKADVDLKGAQAGYYRSGGGAGARSAAKEEPVLEDYVEDLIDGSPDLREQYTKGKDAPLTPAEFRQLASEHVAAMAGASQDHRKNFNQTIQRYLADKRVKGLTRQARGFRPLDEEEDSLP